MSNLELIQLKENLIKTLNDSQLPVIAKQLILGEIQGMVSSLIPQIIESEKQALKDGEENGEKVY